MKTDPFIKILERAEKKGLYNMVEVTDIVKELITDSNLDVHNPIINWWKVPYDLLYEFNEQEYIHYIIFDQSDINPPKDWADKLVVKVCIKPKGLLFLYEKEKIKFSNKSVWYTIISLGLTLFFSAFALGFTVANYNIAQSNAHTGVELLPLQKRIQQQDILLKQAISQIDSLAVVIDQKLVQTSPKKK